MGNLLMNEWIKIFRKLSTTIMIVLLLLGIVTMGAFYKYQETTSTTQVNENWKQELQTQISSDQEGLTTAGENNANMKTYYERQIALNEYRIENDIAPNNEQHIWTFVGDSQMMISLAGLFSIIIAAGIVSSEFSSGTIKLLLIRPISRVKILLSKYITVLLFGILMLAIIYLFSSLVGLVLFGLPSTDVSHLAYSNGEVIERSISFNLVIQYLLSSIDILMIATMAFMISSAFRNSSFAIGISLFLLFMGGTATILLASWFDWTKYILFANTDLTAYFDGVPIVEGMTLSFSIVMLLIYFLIFHLLAFGIFAKRDVAA
ncbi:ABC transporter permease [Aquibacillus rhizosphaerae]|uniref:ABC transporter permease n=1 Tax=Aquibacillus rhizosphaerae TaxID=3051431 RepID=A0ABT7L1M3_9BACI|nr:ABC transporter permease [Aquibacillus sp. LR5S19]MDL4839746.1 ABC transporter permease [Aquibacillus sp. LR5S19]